MHDHIMFTREFDIEMDLDSDYAPGACAPGPRLTTTTPITQALDGKSAGRMATAAVLSGVPDWQLGIALEAANRVALTALERSNLAVARRAVARQEALTRELQRRSEAQS